MQTRSVVFLACCLSLGLAGCNGGGNFESPPTPSPLPPVQPPTGANAAVERAFAQVVFALPVDMVQAPGDTTRWYVVEQRGFVRAFDNDPGVSASEVFLDIANRVDATPSEGGLLGIAFHPDYASNDQLYVSYTAANPFRSVVSRFTVDRLTGLADPGSESLILEVAQPNGNHNGGQIRFGPDGLLYIGLGDGGGAGDPGENGQNTGTLLGAILRIDVDSASPYAVPATNPFAGNTECAGIASATPCPEIYAWGFRNPWRFSFDQQTGELWVGDVGQGQWEEIDRVEAGLNYGWNDREGAHCYDPPAACSMMNVDPITEYAHGVGFSITGGYVYRGTGVPGLQGQYLFGDFVSGRLWAVAADSPQGQVTPPTELLDTALSISSFAQSPDGEVYVLDYTGPIYRIVAP